MRNIIRDQVNGKIANIDKAIKEGKHDRMITKSEICTLVWNSPEIKARQKQFIANQQQGWPDIDAYNTYIYKLIERTLRKQTVFWKGDKKQLLPVFPSFRVPSRREHLYCRRTHLTPDELRRTGRSYLTLGRQNTVKGQIFLTVADEMESKGLKFSSDDLWKQVTETLMSKA